MPSGVRYNRGTRAGSRAFTKGLADRGLPAQRYQEMRTVYVRQVMPPTPRSASSEST